MSRTLGNKCFENCCKRTILVEVIVEDVVTCFFFGTQCSMLRYFNISINPLWCKGNYSATSNNMKLVSK